MNSCKDNHQQIMYEGGECPLCLAKINLDEVLDAKTEIEEQDIFDLYDEMKLVQRRIKRLEKHTGLTPIKHHWWSSKRVIRTSAAPTPREANF